MYIAGMMHTVVGRRYENIFNGRGEFFDVFGVDPKLVQDACLVTDKKHKGIEADQNGGNKEDELNMLCPSQPEGNGKVILAGVMVGDVGGPPESFFMGNPVRPVIAKIDDDKTSYKGPPGDGDLKR